MCPYEPFEAGHRRQDDGVSLGNQLEGIPSVMLNHQVTSCGCLAGVRVHERCIVSIAPPQLSHPHGGVFPNGTEVRVFPPLQELMFWSSVPFPLPLSLSLCRYV